MPSLIATNQNLQDSDTKSRAAGLALLLRSLAGRARIAAELAQGMSAAAAAGEMSAVPRNPSGDVGVNLSGPPWGSAWRSTHAGCGGAKISANFLGQRLIGSVLSTRSLTIPVRYYQQPFDLYDKAPWSRMRPVIRCYRAAAGAHDIVLTCSRESGVGGDRSLTFNVSGTAEQTIDDGALYWDIKPGWNRLLLEVTSATATAAHICGLDLAVIEKRSY